MNDTKSGKTFHLVEERSVTRPVHEVFQYAADFANSQEWDPGVKSAKKTSSGPVEVGTTYQLEGHFGPTTIEMAYEVAAFEPNKRIVLEGSGNGFTSRDEMRFEAVDDGTRIEYIADITLTNFLRFLGPLLSGSMKKMGERALDGLASSLSP